MVATVVSEAQIREGEALLAEAEQRAGGLYKLGVTEGDVVATMLRNGPSMLEVILLTRLAGCSLCPVNWHLKAAEAEFISADSGAAVLIVHADLLPSLRSVLSGQLRVVIVEPEASVRAAFALLGSDYGTPEGATDWRIWSAGALPASVQAGVPRPPMFYSSGTTGRPRGIRREPHTAEQVALGLERMRQVYGIQHGVRTAAIAPLYHAAPLSHAISSLMLGELIVVHPRFDAERVLADVERHGLTNLLLVPTMLIKLLQLPGGVKCRYDLSSLQHVILTGSPCPPQVKRAMIDWWGPLIHETYASSESGSLTHCISAEALERPGTVGKPVRGVELRIFDDEGRELPSSTPGIVYYRQTAYPDFTYVNDEAARRRVERDGLITLGDIGYIDDAGYLFLCDRKADLVISGGVNIYPAEIEAVLIGMPGVADCAVFGIPDPVFGETLAAYVQPSLSGSVRADEVRAFLAERLARLKVPRVVELVGALPREETGKIFKRKLRDPYWVKVQRRI
jgi:long-chain acyl-CoA synthetase